MSIIGAVFVAGAYGAATCANPDFDPVTTDPCLANDADDTNCTGDCSVVAGEAATCVMATQDCAGVTALADNAACEALTNCAYTAMSAAGACDGPADDTDLCPAGATSEDDCAAVVLAAGGNCAYDAGSAAQCNYIPDPCLLVAVAECDATAGCALNAGGDACAADDTYPDSTSCDGLDETACGNAAQCDAVPAVPATCTQTGFTPDPCISIVDDKATCEADTANSCVFMPTTGASCAAKTDSCAVNGDSSACDTNADGLTCDFTAGVPATCTTTAGFTPTVDPCIANIANDASEAACVPSPNLDNCVFTPDTPADDSSSGFRAFSMAAFAAAIMTVML